MKILIHGINYSPELTGIGKYSGEMAEWLVARGHEVRVVTAPPYYPEWRVADGYSAWCYRREITSASTPTPTATPSPQPSPARGEGVEVYRCPLWVPARPSGLKRILHLASFALSSLPVMLRQIFWKPDVVWVVAPALFCAPQAWLVARLCGAKSWLHIQDFEVDAAFDLGLLKGAWLKRMVLGAERWLMRRFDVVSTISERMIERLQAKGVDEGRLVLFPNWVDVSMFKPSADGLPPFARNDGEVNHYRALLGIAPDAVVALYSGNMGAKQGLEVLAQAAKLCAEPVCFVFCGNGVGRADLVERCQSLENVQFIDLQPAQRLPDLLAMADIHLLPQRADAADLVMPSKLTGMLASGRPVVATALAGTALAQVVQGLLVPPDDPQAMADAIMALAANAGWRARLGAAGRVYAAQHMDSKAVLAAFEEQLLALQSSKAGR